MEGHADGVVTSQNLQPDDPLSGKFTWSVQNLSKINDSKHYSDTFISGGYTWRILVFPKGNDVDSLSIYLGVADAAALPNGWTIYTHFSLAVVNQLDPKWSVRKVTKHQFDAEEKDWGFASLIPLQNVYDQFKGYLVSDTLVVEADVKVVDYWKSMEEPEFVGLKNQGAFGYMNSLLQTLYHIPYFRKAVYHMPTTENDVPSNSIQLALQSLFYKIHYSDSSVSTEDLTKSFGWDTYDSFIQHDVQEPNRVLWEKLKDKLKGTAVEETIQQLFEGHRWNYTECINVDYKSTQKESFYGLQLDVNGCKDVYESFNKYVEVEKLEGDSKYHAEHYGLQGARKGVLFIDFPSVLQLQLKRFEYDFTQDTKIKINDRYEFPLQLDLDRENGRYLSPDADRSVQNLYTLHSVLVHSGRVHGGHYYAFIRPTLSDDWYKFDDERVTKEKSKMALEEQYGGEEELPQTNPGFNNLPFKFTKYSNAYMLVYIRKSDKDKIICNVDEKDIPEHLQMRLKKEQEEKKRKGKERAEAHLYRIIKVARDQDLASQVGKDIYFDLVDHDKVQSFRIQKQTPFIQFKDGVAKELGIPAHCQRFWLWTKRQNHTYRPNRWLTAQEEQQTVGHLSDKAHNGELKLFLEILTNQDLRWPFYSPEKTKDDILLFFKLYSPKKEQLMYVGKFLLKANDKPLDILNKLNEMAGFAPHEEIQLYEEIRFEPNVMCEHVEKRTSFRASQLEDGDIICYQKVLTTEEQQQYLYPDVPSYLEYVHKWQMRLKEEQEEKCRKRKERAEAHPYRIIKVARDQDLASQVGKDIYFDLVDHDKVQSFQIQKQTPFIQFKEEIAKELGIPAHCQRFWLWTKRHNHTYRPNRQLTEQEEQQTVGHLQDKAHNAELKLYLEVLTNQDLQSTFSSSEKTKDEVLLFFKLYSPEKEEIRYVGKVFVKVNGKPVDILDKLNEMAGFALHEEIQLYEEIHFEPNVRCELVKKRISFMASQLEDGDIICYQKALTREEQQQYHYPDVPSYLEYVHNQQVYPEGKMSQHIDSLKPRDTLKVEGLISKRPYKANMKKNIGMIARGTGITPMLQIIDAIVNNKDDNTKVSLIYGNISPDDIILKEKLDALAAIHPNFKVYYVVNNPTQGWISGAGCISKDIILKGLPEPSDDTLIFVCGPPGMMKHISGDKAPDESQGEVSGLLKDAGYSKDMVFKF